MLIDRYDEIISALYQCQVPAWIPEHSRATFLRESIRRCCDLGQTIREHWPRSDYYARSVLSEDYALKVYAAWARVGASAPSVVSGLYLAMDEVLRALDHGGPAWELFQFESLAVKDLRCQPRLPSVSADVVRRAGHSGAEVFRFRFRMPELHSRMVLYAGAAAPAKLAREHRVVEQPTYMSRKRTEQGWSVRDVSDFPWPAGAVAPGRAS